MEEHRFGHMAQEHLVAQIRRIAAARADRLGRIRTRGQLAACQRRVRAALARCFGPFPPRTPLNARVTGCLDRGAYRIEKVLYESRPKLLVSANLYLPRGHGPFPAVLLPCGHSMTGKAYPNYQAAAAGLARQGYAVLIFDPLSQGERWQGLEGPMSPDSGCCREHNLLGNAMRLTGEFLGTWRTWDAIRSLDYLLSRPEVDAARVGITGCSGGGLMTSYVWAFDRRLTMAAPSCYVTRLLCNAENELPADAEQMPPNMLAEGLDIADFFVARVPAPVILLGQDDDFFDPRGLAEVYAELRRLYRLAGAEQNVQLCVGQGGHGFSPVQREAMCRFFNRHAGIRAVVKEPRGWRPEKVEDLAAAPGGEVINAGSRIVPRFTAERAAELSAGRRVKPSELPATIARLLALPDRPAPRRPAEPPHYRILRPCRVAKELIESTVAVETEPGMVALLHTYQKTETFRLQPPKSATLYVPHRSSRQEAVAGLAPAERPLLAVDVRGIGQLIARTCGDDDFFTCYGQDYFYASHGDMLGQPLLGRRVHDLLTVLDLLQAGGCGRVHLVGRGLGAVIAALAACLHGAVGRVSLHNAPRSFGEMASAKASLWPASSLIPNVLAHFDLPDCYRLLRRKGMTIRQPWGPRMA